MDLTDMLTIGFVVLVLGWMIYNQLATGRARGQSTELLQKAIPDLVRTDRALVYCYSPGCPPCRSMTPHIDRLARETGRVFKLDITQYLEVARSLGIRVTPTTLVVAKGEIREVLVGTRQPQRLREALENTA